MMNQGGKSEIVAPLSLTSLENRCAVNANQGQATSSVPPITVSESESVSWSMHRMNNCSTENGVLANANYQPNQQIDPAKNVHDGLNAGTLPSSASLGTANVQQVYNGYASYPNSSNPYGFGSTGYTGYHNGCQQQPNYSYSQPVGAYQNTGVPYQPGTSFQNTVSYAGPTSYSSTYYNPGDYQNAGGYPISGYSNQTNSWNEASYGNYNSEQYSNYTPDSTSAYSSTTAPETTFHYQQQYKQWKDYYSQTEVTCAPGTENLSVASTSNQCGVPVATGGYPTSNSLPPPPFTSPPSPPLQSAAAITGTHDAYWKHGAPSSSPVLPQYQKPVDAQSSNDSFRDQQKTACPPAPNSQYPPAPQMTHNYQLPLQNVPSSDTQIANKWQIPTNPRMASKLPLGLPKVHKDCSTTTTSATTKPVYISVSFPKPDDKVLSHDTYAADSILKPGMFPQALRGYVERALIRCKNDSQVAGCQAVLKEMITKATSDGTLYTRDWDTEPLFPLPNLNIVNKDLQFSAPISSLPKHKRSPSRPFKSRWEPLPEEKSVDKQASVCNDTTKNGSRLTITARDLKVNGNYETEDNGFTTTKIWPLEKKTANKDTQRPLKRQHIADMLNAAHNADASSDSDKEKSLTAYSGAIALSNSPAERKRRENRSKRFERMQGHREEVNHHTPKNAESGNLYARRASALELSKTFDDCVSRAVEDIDWDALTVKGTCQEIEKRYLRLTSSPDPASIRPEEVLEKALHMVQNSQKNYLYKCDQLKSIRQDLTVQRIHNHLTVRVYETHARFALEVGDLPEYNQCQSQLKTLYAEGIEGSHMEFSAYNLLCVIMHSNNNRDLLSSMSRLSVRMKEDDAVKHALAVRSAVTSGNYVMFFRLYKTAPNLNTCLMDPYVEKMRYKAVSCMSRSYRPTLPVSYIAQVLGFTSDSATNEGHDSDSDGLEECVEWLKGHGACIITDNNGEIQLDAKASSSGLYMPEPEDAVSHGDASLAVNDFLTRTPLQPS